MIGHRFDLVHTQIMKAQLWHAIELGQNIKGCYNPKVLTIQNHTSQVNNIKLQYFKIYIIVVKPYLYYYYIQSWLHSIF